MVSDQLLLLGVGHFVQRVVLAGELAGQTAEGVGDQRLHLAPFGTCAVGWQTDSAETAAGTYTAAENVVLVKLTAFEVGGVQVGLVLGIGSVAGVALVNDVIQELLEDLVGFFVTGDATHGHDEGVT